LDLVYYDDAVDGLGVAVVGLCGVFTVGGAIWGWKRRSGWDR
jgi:hypothetical protein